MKMAKSSLKQAENTVGKAEIARAELEDPKIGI